MSLGEVEVTKENRHKVFVLFLKGILKVPNRNREVFLHTIRSIATIDCPFLILRVLLSRGLRMSESPMVVKNIVALLYHAQTVVNYLRWQHQAHQLRKMNQRALRAFDS